MTKENLLSAFHYHRTKGVLSTYPRPGRGPWINPANEALAAARRDVATGKTRYAPSPWAKPGAAVSWDRETKGLAHVDSPYTAGLRHVGNVDPESGRGRDIWARGDGSGYYTDPMGDVFKDGSGLCWGVVYQLPGRDGQSRFVAGYQFGGIEGGPTLDLGTVYSEPNRYFVPARTTPAGTFGGYWEYTDSARDMDAARDAARVADSMAQHAAEVEREYQTAWQAGRVFADELESAVLHRAELRALLQERRAVKTVMAAGAMDSRMAARVPGNPLVEGSHLCRAIEGAARDLINTIKKAKATAAKAASGDLEDLYFAPNDSRHAEAFCEAAGLTLEQFKAL